MKRIVSALLGLCLFVGVGSLVAQQATANHGVSLQSTRTDLTVTSAESETGNSTKIDSPPAIVTPPTIGAKDLKYLEPSVPDRILRAWQYQLQLLEQPAFIVATTGTTTTTISNPQKWLPQHAVIFQFSELFPRVTNFPAMVQAAYSVTHPGTLPSAGMLDPSLCRNHDTLECLASGGNVWGRLLSGAKLTFSVAQRDQVQQGVLLTNLSTSQGWGWNGQVDFDPSSLFITSANWKSAVSVLSKGGTATDGLCFFQNQKPSSDALRECENQFARPMLTSWTQKHGLTKLAAFAIPTFQLKYLSQFDFIKQGGLLIENPNLQRSLKSMTFTWDFRRLIAGPTDRVTIGTLYGQSVTSKDPKQATSGDANTSQLCVLSSGRFRSYVAVAPGSSMDSCRAVAVALGSVDRYAAACATDRKVDIGLSADVRVPLEEKNKPDTNCGWRLPPIVNVASNTP
ncbi:MAG TPA: hypothetical protein VKH81_02025 [Candidatus Angelobacter sp.]|nr:hypothetical protein [Candidatus Angelobacter sp.]